MTPISDSFLSNYVWFVGTTNAVMNSFYECYWNKPHVPNRHLLIESHFSFWSSLQGYSSSCMYCSVGIDIILCIDYHSLKIVFKYFTNIHCTKAWSMFTVSKTNVRLFPIKINSISWNIKKSCFHTFCFPVYKDVGIPLTI